MLKNTINKTSTGIFSNIIWLFFDKFFGAVLTIIIFSKLATYFGKELFGVWNYIISFSTIILAIGGLGLNFVVVRRLRQSTLLKQKIISTAFKIRLFTGLFAAILTFIIYLIVGTNTDQKFILAVIFIFFSQVIINANVFIFWNESLLKNKSTVLTRNIALTCSFFLKILGIYLEKDITFFAFINCLEAVIFIILINKVPNKIIDILDVSIPNNEISLPMLKEGLPLMLSALVVTIYLKIDQLIIGYLLDNERLAIYASATRITEMLYAAPVIVSNVFFPKIIDAFKVKKNQPLILQKLFAIVTIIVLILVVFVYLGSSHIILLLFDSTYNEAVEILKIYIWSLFFMALLVTSSKYLLVKKRGDIILKRDILGLLINIALNFILIPVYGIKGAAIATLISYFVASYGANIFFKELRPLMITQITSVFFLHKLFIKSKDK